MDGTRNLILFSFFVIVINASKYYTHWTKIAVISLDDYWKITEIKLNLKEKDYKCVFLYEIMTNLELNFMQCEILF